MRGTLSELLRHQAFTRFWTARVAGIMANQMLMVAVGWHMYELTSSAWDLGLVGLFQFVPALLMTLPAGQAADRWHRAAGRVRARYGHVGAGNATTAKASFKWTPTKAFLIQALEFNPSAP